MDLRRLTAFAALAVLAGALALSLVRRSPAFSTDLPGLHARSAALETKREAASRQANAASRQHRADPAALPAALGRVRHLSDDESVELAAIRGRIVELQGPTRPSHLRKHVASAEAHDGDGDEEDRPRRRRQQ